MSLTSALNSAGSGLATAQTQTSLIADNIANATNAGYVRRDAVIVSTGTGGAQVAEVRRDVDTALVRMARSESSKMAHQQAVFEALEDYTLYLGKPGDGTSMPDKFSAFNTALTTLVNMPSSTEAQSAAVYGAENLAASIRDASGTLSQVRADVDMEIRYEIADLNQALYDLAELNGKMLTFEPGTLQAAALNDQMDGLLDRVSEIVGVRITHGSDNTVSIYSTGGAALLEGTGVRDVSYNSGDGTFYAGGVEITPGKHGIRGIEEGSLAGFAELQTNVLPRFQLQLDEYARGLIQAFEASDASLSPGDAGLFTDNGLAFDPANLAGLANRIQVNQAVSHDGDSEIWRIRDGMAASEEGAAAEAGQILDFIDGLRTPVGADPATGVTATVTVAEFGNQIVTMQAAESSRAETNFNAASSAAEMILASRRNVEGVNIDDELQKLLLIEQSYAANSKMLTTVADMLDMLLAAV